MEERPLECNQCKKKVSVLYQEVIGTNITVYQMCKECPILKQKLEGKKEKTSSETMHQEEALCCDFCQTSLESVLLGHPLGCKECYQVFQEVLTNQLTLTNQIAPNLTTSQKSKSSTFHFGKSPQINKAELNSTRLKTLTEALNDALNSENYEQAAWLRDQIDSLGRKTNEKP